MMTLQLFPRNYIWSIETSSPTGNWRIKSLTTLEFKLFSGRVEKVLKNPRFFKSLKKKKHYRVNLRDLQNK